MMHIAILAGGRSRRMGRDKLRLPWGESDLLGHVVSCAQATGNPVLLLGGGRDIPDCTRLPDQQPGAGPLPALRDALQQVDDAILLLAADLPLMSGACLEHLLAQDCSAGLAVEGPRGIEPCCSIYQTAVLSLMDARISQGRRSLKGLIAESAMPRYHLPERFHQTLLNCNTLADWDAITAASTSFRK